MSGAYSSGPTAKMPIVRNGANLKTSVSEREEFMRRCHNRSNVESTFSMLTAKFGDSVRSKTDTAMKNEVLAKIVCHKIAVSISAMLELGIDLISWAEKPVVQINKAAS